MPTAPTPKAPPPSEPVCWICAAEMTINQIDTYFVQWNCSRARYTSSRASEQIHWLESRLFLPRTTSPSC